MAYHTTAWGERLWRWAMQLIAWLPGKVSPASPISPEINSYQSAMTTQFNWLHEWIFPHFFRQIQVESFTLEPMRQLPQDASIVYVTPIIGQLEYNYFNCLYTHHQFPLPQLSNGLSLFFWRPWTECRRMAQAYTEATRKDGHITSPVRSGLWQRLITDGVPTFIQLKTSRMHDDLYWDDPEDDPLAAVITAAQTGTRPVLCIPQDFIWSKHPDRQHNALTLFLIGDRDKRGPIRRFFFFLLYYKRHAVVKFAQPLCIQEWLALQPANTPLPQLIKALRAELLTQLRIERTAITGPGIKPRNWLIEQVVHSEAVQRSIYDIAQDRKKPITQVQDLARSYADEIAADPHHSQIEIAGRIMNWVLRTLYEGITVDEEGLQTVKRAMGNGPIVLVPSHRSHMDYLLISTILYSRNVAVPFIAGGINMNFWPVGPMFRHCGAFFLRRSFGGNPLYKAVFQSYITELVRQNYCQEFFIEGTRSRTGKMGHAKLGMLSMLIESWRAKACADITFVPVAITYDQVMEARSYAKELKGAGKVAERARDIMKIGRFFKHRWGHVYLRFGEPISLGMTAAELWSNPDPTHITADTKPVLVRHIANSILYAINRQTVVTPAALIGMILLSQDKASGLEDITQRARTLLRYLTWKEAPCSPGLATMPEVQLQETLDRLAAAKTITALSAYPPTVYKVHSSHRTILDVAKNTGVHYFVSIACLTRLLLNHATRHETLVPFDTIFHEYTLLKKLFGFEFVFSTHAAMADHIRKLLGYLKDAQMILEPQADHYEVVVSHAAQLQLFTGLLDNYFEAYRILFRFIQDVPQSNVSEKHWLKAVILFGRNIKERGQLQHEESLSKSIFQNGLLLLQELGVIQKSSTGMVHCNGVNEPFNELDKLITSIVT